MANLLSQNIGTNYKSILNLDATTINTPLDATLRAVTDGMGTVSPLQLSTDQVGLIRTVALSAGATNPRLFNEVYTINNSGAQTGTLTGLFLNATETNLNGMTHNLMDLQRNGTSQLSLNSIGYLTTNIVYANACVLNGGSGFGLKVGATRIRSGSDGNFLFLNDAQNNFSTLQLGGITSLFPMIKRNGAAIDFRLADDSGPCNISALGISLMSGTVELNTSFNAISNFGAGVTGLQVKANGSSSVGLDVMGSSTTSNFIQRWRTSALVTLSFIDGFGGAMFGGTSKNASAFVQIDSTTQGFLHPRMTTTQKNAIASPATGLVVFDTTLNKLAVFTTVWETVTSV